MSFLEKYNIRKFTNLDLLAKQVVEGFIIGLHKSPFHGFSVEFAEHRLYNPGDATKDIDWKVYARTDRLYTKKFEEETNLRCQIIIDNSSSMHYPIVKETESIELNKYRFSMLAAAAIMQILQKQRDAFGLSLFSDDVELHTDAKSSMSHYKLLTSQLENTLLSPPNLKTTKTADVLHKLAERIHRRSLVILFTDMFQSGESLQELIAGLQHLKYNKHELLIFHTLDYKHEFNFEFTNRPYQFIDMESGEKIKLRPNQVKDFYKEKAAHFLEEIRMICLQHKIDFIEADINQGFDQVLQGFLIKRKKMSR